MVSLNKARKFYERRAAIRRIVLNRLRQSKNVMTGQRAVNIHLSKYPHLQNQLTRDYDILVRKGMTPIQAAERLEKDLDSKFGGDFFSVTTGVYPDVRKVVDINNNEVADFVPMPKPKPKIKKSNNGIRYVGLKYLKERFKSTLDDPLKKFRHRKDLESLKRIEVYEKYHKPRTGITGSDVFKWKPLPKVKVKKIKKQKGGDYFKW